MFTRINSAALFERGVIEHSKAFGCLQYTIIHGQRLNVKAFLEMGADGNSHYGSLRKQFIRQRDGISVYPDSLIYIERRNKPRAGNPQGGHSHETALQRIAMGRIGEGNT